MKAVQVMHAITTTVSTVVDAYREQGKTVDPAKLQVDAGVVTNMKRYCDHLKGSLGELNSTFTLMAVQDFEVRLRATGITYSDIIAANDDISRSLERELRVTTILVLNSQERSWYVPAEPLLGSKFEGAFKTEGAFELEEASKCMALGRPTAAVFHLMRIMETGIRAMAACLSIPDPVKPAERNWAIVLKKVHAGIEAKWPTAADRMKGDGALFEALHASLDAIKNPFRNATMHVENKYTDAEAQHIFALVKGFMMKLADRCDETGSPKA